MKNITFQTSDKELIQVDLEIAQHIRIINMMLEGCGMEESKQTVIPLAHVSSKIFRLVLEWLEHHKHDAPLKKEDGKKEKRSDDITPWDQQFMEMEQVDIFEIMNAANFFAIEELLKLCCKTVANMIKGKSVVAIRDTFNIMNDYTPEEEEEVRKQNAWAEDK